ncbi:MAG: hypothetical protein ACOYMN_24290 [Roseimicrobium sp.]
MNPLDPSLTILLAATAEGEAELIPLVYQILCIFLTALFLWTFSIARDPRGWRRLYQAKLARNSEFSVNRNKKIDEIIKKYGIPVAMIFLVLDVSCFVMGVTHRYRQAPKPMTQEERFRAQDTQRIMGNTSKESRRGVNN